MSAVLALSIMAACAGAPLSSASPGAPILSNRLIDPGTNPVLTPGYASNSIDSVEDGDVCAAKVGTNDYRLIVEYIGRANVTRSGLATGSAALGPWSKYGGQGAPAAIIDTGPAAAWDHYQVAAGSGSCVVLDSVGGQWVYYYQARPNGATGYDIGYATTPTGSAWEAGQWIKDATNPVLTRGATGWDSAQVVSPSVIQGPNSAWYMFYQGMDAAGTYRCGYATAPAPVGKWTKYSGNPTFTIAVARWPGAGTLTACSVLFAYGKFRMWYSTTTGIGYADSPDGVTWTDGPSNPVLTGSPANCPSSGPAGDSITAILWDGVVYVWGHCYNLSATPELRAIAEYSTPVAGGP